MSSYLRLYKNEAKRFSFRLSYDAAHHQGAVIMIWPHLKVILVHFFHLNKNVFNPELNSFSCCRIYCFSLDEKIIYIMCFLWRLWSWQIKFTTLREGPLILHLQRLISVLSWWIFLSWGKKFSCPSVPERDTSARRAVTMETELANTSCPNLWVELCVSPLSVPRQQTDCFLI